MIKMRGSFKSCIMLSALDYSKPQQLKIYTYYFTLAS